MDNPYDNILQRGELNEDFMRRHISHITVTIQTVWNLHSRLRMDHLVRSKHYTSQFITGLWTLKMFLNQSLKMNTRKWTNTWFQTILWKNWWMSVAWMTTVQTSSRIEAIFMGELLFLEFHKWAKSFLWNQFQLSQWKVFVLHQRKKTKQMTDKQFCNYTQL